MKKVKARWFWLAFFLTASPLWNPTNSAIFVLFNVVNFTLLVIAIIKSIPIIKSFFSKNEK